MIPLPAFVNHTQFQYEVSGEWEGIEIGVEAGELYSISAVGSYRISDDAEKTDAAGLAFRPFRYRMGGQDLMDRGYYRRGISKDALIGRFVGQDWSFCIGEELRFIAPANFAIELRINSEEDLIVKANQFLDIVIEEIEQDVLINSNGIFNVSARLDTSDFITVGSNGVRWAHSGTGYRVGFHSGRHPTLLNGVAWWPSWRHGDLESKRLSISTIWNSTGVEPRVSVESGRGDAEIVDYNESSIVVKIVDDGSSSGTMAIQIRH